jgi:TPP-dependent indolepyruvate ferredoxin oxidoreductase alpha subunit
MVAEEVKAFIEKEVKPVLGVYKKIAMGVKRKRFHPKTGEKYFEIEYDPGHGARLGSEVCSLHASQ